MSGFGSGLYPVALGKMGIWFGFVLGMARVGMGSGSNPKPKPNPEKNQIRFPGHDLN